MKYWEGRKVRNKVQAALEELRTELSTLARNTEVEVVK